jgi:hypothetical protein
LRSLVMETRVGVGVGTHHHSREYEDGGSVLAQGSGGGC